MSTINQDRLVEHFIELATVALSAQSSLLLRVSKT